MKGCKLLSLTLILGSLFWGEGLIAGGVASLPEEHDSVRESLYHLDDQIDSLVRLRNYYSAKAARYRSRATRVRLQENPEGDEQAERLVEQAEDYDQIVKKLNGQICQLEKERKSLEKKLPENR